VEALAEIADIAVATAQLALASNYPETAAAAPGREDADVTALRVASRRAKFIPPMEAEGFLWPFCNIVDNLSTRIYWRAEKLDDHVSAGWAGIFGWGLTLVAACLAIAVARDITSRQEERRKRLMDASQQKSWPAGASPNLT
jgi:hypothetical protein